MASLKSFHTFALSAQCPEILTINSVDSLISTLKELLLYKPLDELVVLGEGSNTVFVHDIKQTVILNRIKGIDYSETSDAYSLCVGAGENWHQVVKQCIDKGIGGFENLALIPGTVGAAPIQNIGAYGVEIEQFIEKVEFLDTQSMTIKLIERAACQFAYRDSIFKHQALNQRIITRVFFTLPKHYQLCLSYGPLQKLNSPSANDVFNEVIKVRKSKLPDVKLLGNAGSFFKNPVVDQSHFARLQELHKEIPHYKVEKNKIKIPAAWLIDSLGFKGKRQGDIACHEHQALVLVNLGDGTGEDLLSMATQIKHKVEAVFDITLENEVRLIGQNGLIQL